VNVIRGLPFAEKASKERRSSAIETPSVLTGTVNLNILSLTFLLFVGKRSLG
jgi:hypothetical protein